MSDSADVVVVGAGVVGASIAFHLAQAGMQVIVVDAKDVASGATGASGGLIRVHDSNPNFSLLAQASTNEFTSWADSVGGSINFVRTGCLHSIPADQAPALETAVAKLQERGAKCEIVDPAELRSRHPEVTWPDGAITIWEPDAGYADPRRCARNYLDGAIEKGGQLLTGTEVVGLRAKNGQLAGIQTSSGLLATETAVFAIGAWAATWNLVPGLQLPVRTKRIFSQRLLVSQAISGLPALVDESKEPLWFRPDGPQHLLMGGRYQEWDLDPDKTAPPADKSSTKTDRLRLQERLTQHQVSNVLDVNSGLDAYTPDSLPIIDRGSLIKGLYFAVGFSGGGFKVAPAAGRALAEWITSGHIPQSLSPFSLKRFREIDADARPVKAAGRRASAQTEQVAPKAPAANGLNASKPVSTVESAVERAQSRKRKRKRKRRPGRPAVGETNSVSIDQPKPRRSTHNDIRVRQTTEGDLDALMEMVLAYIDFYKSPQPERRSLEALLRHIQLDPAAGRQFVATLGNKLAGFATLYFSFSTLRAQKMAIMNDLFVAPDYRKSGIGKALFETCLAFAKDNGFAYMEWVTAPDNEGARAFYEKIGAQTQPWIVYGI